MSATNSYDLLKDIEKKLKIEYKHRYDIELYDKEATTANFVLIHKGFMGFGASTLLISNYLDDLTEEAQGIEIAMEYLNSLPKYKGKLKIELQQRKIRKNIHWSLHWVDYWTNIDGQESKIHNMITASKLSNKDKTELYNMLMQKERKVFAGYIPGDKQRAQSIMGDISAGAFRQLTEAEEARLKGFVKLATSKLDEDRERLN